MEIFNRRNWNLFWIKLGDVLGDETLSCFKLQSYFFFKTCLNTFLYRGFVKYKRETVAYKPVDVRMKDWGEIYNSSHVRKGLKMQAAR